MSNISDNILKYLPEVLRSNPNVAALIGGINPSTGLPSTYVDPDLIVQTAGIGGFLEQLASTVNMFKYYNDFSNIPISQLNNFVAQYGVVFPPAMSEASRRKLARDIIQFNRANGSIRCLEYIFSIIGLQVEIQHTWMLDSDLRLAEFQTENFNYILSNPVLSGTSYIDQIIITDPGSGYGTPPTATFTGGGGSGAAATVLVSGGLVTGFTITNYGTGYTSTPSINFSGPGTGAQANTTITLPQLPDGSVSFHDGMYMFGTDTITSTYYQRIPIKNENYIPGAYVAPDNEIAVKLPYLYLNITSKNYGALTSNYTDPVTGVVTPFSATDKFTLIEQITTYFTSIVRPSNVVFLNIASTTELVDIITSVLATDTIGITYVNAGVLYDGSISYGTDIDRYTFGLDFGGFEYGNTNMTTFAPGTAPSQNVTDTYDASVAGLEKYICSRANTNIFLQVPVGCVAQVLGSSLPRTKMAIAQINYQNAKQQMKPLAPYFNAFNYNQLGVLTGKAMSSAGTLTYTSTTITRASGSWTTDKFQMGDQIIISGSSIGANNGLIVTITNVNSATEITVSGPALTGGTSTTDVIGTCYSQNVFLNFSVALNILTAATGTASMKVTLN